MKTRLRMDRAIGVVVVCVSLAAALLLWLGLTLSDPAVRKPPESGVVFDTWQVLYDSQAPSMQVILFAIAIALLLAAIVAMVERRITNRYRRSDTPGIPLAPKIVMRETEGVFHGPVTITVLIPAHNEQDRIGATLVSLMAQNDPPERIVVVADNCTDSTISIARSHGVEVFETVDNTHKKGGGLNQALKQILPGQGENDCIMVMDADTVLDQGYFTAARQRLTSDRALMAVGGVFYGEEGGGLLGQFQRNEYTRYSREINRRRGRVYVLTGTASVFRPRAMRAVADARGSEIPGTKGEVYDTAALTEDNELTLAIKSMGGLMVSPQQCSVVTEVMPSWRALWAQRLRWQRGALENLGAYGFTPQTSRYWAQQLGLAYGALALFTYAALIIIMLVSLDRWVWFPFWAGLGLLFMVERVVSVWKGGWRARLVAATLIPELIYSGFLSVVFLKGVWDIASGRKAEWRHVVKGPGGLAIGGASS